MTTTGKETRIALITTVVPSDVPGGKASLALYSILARRMKNDVVDIFAWNDDKLPHKQAVIAAETLRCGLTELRTPLPHRLFGIKRYKLPAGVKRLIMQSYNAVWIVGDNLAHLHNEFSTLKTIDDNYFHSNI